MTGNVLIDEVELGLKSTICSPPACLPAFRSAMHAMFTALSWIERAPQFALQRK
jgi:hypothetical protein